MGAGEPQRKLRQSKNNDQGVYWEQAAKDEALWIEKKYRPWSEIGKAQKKEERPRENLKTGSGQRG